jgi:hypothetical protein
MTRADERRLWAGLDQSGGPDSCWPWTGPAGIEWFRPQRAAWLVAHGPTPKTQLVAATCGTANCCNPAHLKLTTQAHLKKPPHKIVLTKEIAAEIRKAHAKGGVLQRELAERFNVSQANISFIVRGLTWRPEGHRPKKRRVPS